MANKKYYWLKLKEDFFEEDTIQWLEEQENGKDYCLFYLKLCLKSLKTNGILIRNVGQILVPYDIKKLAEMTNTNNDTAIVAMEIFKKIGLVQILENGEIYITQLNNMVGSETSKAELMRKKREREKIQEKQGNNVTNLLPTSYSIEEKCYTEIENRERNKELEKERDNKSQLSTVVCSNIEVFKYFEKCGFIISSKLMEFIAADIEIFGSQWLMDAADVCVKRGKLNNYGYLTGILQNWQTEGRGEKKEKSNTTAYEPMKSILDE